LVVEDEVLVQRLLKEEKPAEEQMILTKILSETESKNIMPKLQKLQNYTKNKVNM
jgi:hypothetical protein